MFGKKLKEYDLSDIQSKKFAKVTTSKGEIWLTLLPDEAPNTVANFASLSESGFYNGLKFHRVIKGFMAQGGCPRGTGTGGPDWAIKCETSSNTTKHKKGVLSMAHAGPNTGGSQFFICFADCPHLDGVHTVFGKIDEEDASSMMALDMIEQNDIIESIEICSQK